MIPLQAPEAIADHFIEAWNARDAERLAAVFVEDAEFVNVVGLWWHHRERIFQAHDYGLRVIFKHSTLSLMRSKVRHLGSHAAIVHAKMRLVDQTALDSGPTPQERQTIFLFVLQQDDQEHWWCEAAHNTEVLPGMETFVRDPDGTVRAVNYGQFHADNT